MIRKANQGDERRRFPRTRISASVRIHKGGYMVNGALIDISIGGLLAEAEIQLADADSDRVFAPGVEISIDIPKLHLSSLPGRILRKSNAGIGHSMAIEFTAPKPEIAHRIIERFTRR